MKKRILFVGHDANRAGAQLFLLQVIQSLVQRYDCTLLLLDAGELLSDYQAICPVILWEDSTPSQPWWKKQKVVNQQPLTGQHFDIIYLNTIAVARVFPWLKAHVSGRYVSHLHELEFSQTFYSRPEDRAFLWQHADRFIGCSDAVSEYIRPIVPPSISVDTIHSFVDNEAIKKRVEIGNPDVSKSSLGIAEDCFLVGGCGQADWRKGMDLFLQTAAYTPKEQIHFVWIGFPSSGLFAEQTRYDLKRMGLESHVTLLPVTPLSVEWLAELDLFLLPSREDPFPLVMLEAALAEVPVLGFKQSGGCDEFVQMETGWTVPYADCQALADKISELKQQPHQRIEAGKRAKDVVERYFQFDRSMEKVDSVLTQMMTS